MEEIKKSDIVIGDNVRVVKSVKNDTGYPDNLTEEQIVRLIYFFGSRKLIQRANPRENRKSPDRFAPAERMFVDEAFKWFGFRYETTTEFMAAYRMLTVKFKMLLNFLKKRPAFITKNIYQALKAAGYNNIITNIVFVVDENNNVVPRLASANTNKETIPLGKAETMLWDIQNITLDKMLMILESITPKDVKRANLGTKSKALRDLFAMFHMSRLNTKNPNLTLINLSVHTAEPTEKIRVYSTYLNKNREAQ